MTTYIHKPTKVEAELYHPGMEDGWHYIDSLHGDSYDTEFIPEGSKRDLAFLSRGVIAKPCIRTLNGMCDVNENYYIVTKSENDHYAVRKDIFEDSYEKAN